MKSWKQPYKFPAEFTIEQAYLGGADVQRGTRSVKDFDEYYSNLVFVYTPRIKFGILRLGAQWERYSFGFPDGGQQLPNTLQAINSIVGLDTKFSDSILVRLEAQPGFYDTSFAHLDGDSFNIPFVLGGTYIHSAEVQLVFGVGVNVQGPVPGPARRRRSLEIFSELGAQRRSPNAAPRVLGQPRPHALCRRGYQGQHLSDG